MSSWSAPGGDDGRDDTRRPEPLDAPAPSPYAPPYASPYAPPVGAPYDPPVGAPYGTPYGFPAPPATGVPGPYPSAHGAPGPYGARPPMSPRWRASTITQIVLAVVLTAVGCGLGLPSLVLSIVAMTRARRDGASATRLSRIGWVCFGAALVLLAVLWALLLRSGTLSGVPTRVEDV